MKKTITLRVEYLEVKKMNKAEELAARNVLFQDSLVLFKEQLKDNKYKIIKEIPVDNDIVIEFDAKDWDQLNQDLVKSEIVYVIDSFIYKDKVDV